MYLITGNKEECCGCTACQSACPTNSISFQMDEEGFLYPKIDTETCIECHLCEKVCPISSSINKGNNNPEVFAAIQKDVESRKKSSSGGLFTSIAELIIRKGGCVYGASFDRHHQLHHISINNIEDLYKLKGSKYLQSNIIGIYKEIKEKLTKGIWVYFVGTGCQVAGLYAYLRKRYDCLITSDLVCHGVPSQHLFDQHIAYLQNRYNGEVLSYSFRDGEKWSVCESFVIQSGDGRIKRYSKGNYQLSPYLYSFMQGYTFRPACYSCSFASIPRQGDITLADYWGANTKIPNIDSSHGVSLILVNNERGQAIWNEIQSKVESYKSNIDDACENNQNLVRSSVKPAERDIVFKELESKGYDHLTHTLFRPNNHLKIRIVSIIRSLSRPFVKILK